jgi:hypothetical protein
MSDLPIKVTKDAASALAKLGKGLSTIILELDPESEELKLANGGDMDLTAVAAAMPKKEGRYILAIHKHEHKGASATKNVFIYYCPDLAPPRMKMTYSSCKSFVLKAASNIAFTIDKNIEVSVLAC